MPYDDPRGGRGELIARLVARGLGMALSPSAYIGPLAAEDPGLALVPVLDGPHHLAYLVWSRFNPSPATRTMPEVLGVPRHTRASTR